VVPGLLGLLGGSSAGLASLLRCRCELGPSW